MRSWLGEVMSINSVMAIGLQGVQKGLQGMNQNATEIARFGTDKGSGDVSDLAAQAVGLIQNETQVIASTKVIQSADRVLGGLLDVRA